MSGDGLRFDGERSSGDMAAETRGSILRFGQRIMLDFFVRGVRSMIISFSSRRLRRFWEKDNVSKLSPEWIDKISMILDRLDQSLVPEDLDLLGLDFHPLKGEMKGRYAVTVQSNWRISFAWEDGDAVDVDLEDYH